MIGSLYGGLSRLLEKIVQTRIYKNEIIISDADIESQLKSFADRVGIAKESGHYKINALQPSIGDIAAGTLLNGIALLNGGLSNACGGLMPWFQQITMRPAFQSVFGKMIELTLSSETNSIPQIKSEGL